MLLRSRVLQRNTSRCSIRSYRRYRLYIGGTVCRAVVRQQRQLRLIRPCFVHVLSPHASRLAPRASPSLRPVAPSPCRFTLLHVERCCAESSCCWARSRTPRLNASLRRSVAMAASAQHGRVSAAPPPGAYKQCAVLAFCTAQSYAFLFQPALSRRLSAVASDMRTSAAAPPLELVALSDSWLVLSAGSCSSFAPRPPVRGRLGRS